MVSVAPDDPPSHTVVLDGDDDVKARSKKPSATVMADHEFGDAPVFSITKWRQGLKEQEPDLSDEEIDLMAPLGHIMEVGDAVDRLEMIVEGKRRISYRSANANPFPETLLNPPGLVGEIAKWMDACATREAPALSLAASMALMGTIAGRRYKSPSDLRTNIYIVGIAGTGAGKDNARQCIMTLLQKAGAEAFLGTETIASAAGLLNRLHEHPVRVFCLDEFGRMLGAINNARAGNHERQILDELMRMTGAARSMHAGNAYAERPSNLIKQPHLCVYATTTPDAFWQSFTGRDALDGFLNRLLMVESVRGSHRKAPASHSSPPDELVQRIRAIAFGVCQRAGYEGKVGDLQTMETHTSDKVSTLLSVIPFDAGADAAHEAMCAAIELRLDGPGSELWGRTVEHAIRLACILAVGVDPVRPVVTAELFAWGSRFATWCAERMVDAADRYIADSQAAANRTRVFEAIKEAGPDGCSHTRLSRAVRIKPRDRDEAIDWLVDEDRIEVSEPGRRARGVSIARMYRLK